MAKKKNKATKPVYIPHLRMTVYVAVTTSVKDTIKKYEDNKEFENKRYSVQ